MKKVGILIFIVWLCFPVTSLAAEIQAETEEKIFSQFEFQEMEEFLEKVFLNDKIGFQSMIKGLISGELELSAELIVDMISDQFFL